jgi:nucleoside-diphosphate-sugar epimerase
VVGLGKLGAGIATRLAGAGARVTGVRRGEAAPPGVALVRADVTDAASLQRLPADTELLVICLTPDRHDAEGYRQAFVEGVGVLVDRLHQAPIRQALFVSSTAVYGGGSALDLDDQAIAVPDGYRGEILLDAERRLAAAPWPTISLRLSGLYGPGRNALIERALRGRAAPAAPPHWTNRIHGDDAADAVLHLLARAAAGESLPPWVIGSDPTPSPRHEVLAFLFEQLDVASVAVAAGGPDRAASRRLWPRFLETSGFRWRYPDYRVGYAAQLAAMDASGELADLRARIEGELRGSA